MHRQKCRNHQYSKNDHHQKQHREKQPGCRFLCRLSSVFPACHLCLAHFSGKNLIHAPRPPAYLLNQQCGKPDISPGSAAASEIFIYRKLRHAVIHLPKPVFHLLIAPSPLSSAMTPSAIILHHLFPGAPNRHSRTYKKNHPIHNIRIIRGQFPFSLSVLLKLPVLIGKIKKYHQKVPENKHFKPVGFFRNIPCQGFFPHAGRQQKRFIARIFRLMPKDIRLNRLAQQSSAFKLRFLNRQFIIIPSFLRSVFYNFSESSALIL